MPRWQLSRTHRTTTSKAYALQKKRHRVTLGEETYELIRSRAHTEISSHVQDYSFSSSWDSAAQRALVGRLGQAIRDRSADPEGGNHVFTLGGSEGIAQRLIHDEEQSISYAF